MVAAAADAVVLLGEVDDLEVVGEGARDALGVGRAERRDRVAQRRGIPRARAARRAPPALGERADPLLEVEEVAPFLLDERVAEQVAEHRDVAAKQIGRVGGHGQAGKHVTHGAH